MLSLPSPFLPLLPSPCPVHILLIWTVRAKREKRVHIQLVHGYLTGCSSVHACVCYAGDWALSAAFGHRIEGTGQHEDGPVPVCHGQWLGSAGEAAGATPQSVGRAVYEGENWQKSKQWAEGLCVLGTADETGKREKERLGREGGKSCYQLCFGGDQQHKALHHTQRHAHKHTQTLTLICVRKEPACAGSWRENCICLLFSNLPPCKPNDLFVNISSAVWWISQVVFRLYPAELVLLVSAK